MNVRLLAPFARRNGVIVRRRRRTMVSKNGVIANFSGITRKHPDLLPQVRVLFVLVGDVGFEPTTSSV